MRFLSRSFLVVAAFTVAAACGGGGDGDGGQGPGGNTNITAQIDGDDFNGQGTAAHSNGGIYTISGADGTDAISISVFNISGPGTYELGLNATGFGGYAIVSSPNSGWSTLLNGLTGSITITTLTTARIAGTFHYSAAAQNGGAVGTKEVTDGEFDMLLQTVGAGTPPNPWAGSALHGRLGTDTIVGATMAVIFNSNNLLFSAGNLSTALSITLQNLTATGTYTFRDSAPVHRIQFSDVNGANIYITDSTTTGNITVTTLNANRIAGTFTGTLKQFGGAGTKNVSGTFDVGIPH